MLAEALRAQWPIEAVVLRSDRVAQPPPTGGWACYQVEPAAFARLSTQTNPEGVLAVLSFPATAHWEPDELVQLPPGPGFLLADLQDPGNLGTIIRTADWFGFGGVLCSQGCVDVLNPKVLRSTMGSFFRVQVQYVSNFEALLTQASTRCWAADLQGEPLDQAALQPQDWLLIGNEARGLSSALRDLPGLRRLHIPGAGQAESLNAAISAAICGWQLFQRGRQSDH